MVCSHLRARAARKVSGAYACCSCVDRLVNRILTCCVRSATGVLQVYSTVPGVDGDKPEAASPKSMMKCTIKENNAARAAHSCNKQMQTKCSETAPACGFPSIHPVSGGRTKKSL